MSESVDRYLSSVGLKFPETIEELYVFNQSCCDFEYRLSPERIDPYKILDAVKTSPSVNQKVTNVDFHKRTVLAAEIVYQLKNDNYLGHLKLQKLLFLCQNTTNMSLHTNFLKQAMGPFDPKLMRSLDTQFKKNKWFEFQKDEFPKYRPLEKCGEHQAWFNRYFKDHTDSIAFLIETFRPFTTRQIELVATLFACWQEAISHKYLITDDLLVCKLYDWHESKNKFSPKEISNSIGWMKDNGIFPQ